MTQRQNLVYKKELNVTKETKKKSQVNLSDQRTDFLILKETENDHRKIDLKNKLKSLKDEKQTTN